MGIFVQNSYGDDIWRQEILFYGEDGKPYTGIDKDGIIRVPMMENGAVNNSKILYVAPTNEIAKKIKIDIVFDETNMLALKVSKF